MTSRKQRKREQAQIKHYGLVVKPEPPLKVAMQEKFKGLVLPVLFIMYGEPVSGRSYLIGRKNK